MGSTEGRTSVHFLIDRGRLERVRTDDPLGGAQLLVARSRRRLRTAELALDDGDAEGGFVAAYDAFRMSADALLLAQSLRATGGDGSHVAAADAVSAQFGDATPDLRRVIFDRLRRSVGDRNGEFCDRRCRQDPRQRPAQPVLLSGTATSGRLVRVP